MEPGLARIVGGRSQPRLGTADRDSVQWWLGQAGNVRLDNNKVVDLRLGTSAIVMCCLIVLAARAEQPSDVEALSSRIAEIEHAHIRAPWPVSQEMIDELEPALDGAPPELRARVELMEARNMMLDGNYKPAMELLDSVLSRPISHSRRLRALELLINAHYLNQNYERAFDLLSRALALFSMADDDRQKADVLTLAARLYSDVGEHALALERAAESLELAKRTQHARTIFNSLFSLVHVQKNAGLVAFAIERSRELWRHSQQSGDPVSVGSAMRLIGSVYNAAGRYAEATGWLKRAVEKNQETGYRAGELRARKELGKALIEAGEKQQGRDLLLSLAERLDARESGLDLMEVHDVLAASFHAEGRHAEAMKHLREYRSALRRFNDEQRALRLAYIQADFENQRHDQELELLRQQSRLLEMREKTAGAKRSTRILGLTVLIVVGILLVGLLFRFRADRRRFRKLTEIDGLTGLFNHRRFHHAVEDALREAREQGRVSVLVAADVDLFKQVNDRHGHQAGDQVLRKLGALLMEQFPDPCITGRVGGEEFAIFLPDHNRLQARQRISAFRERLEPIEFEGRSIRVTLSFGLVESRHETRLEKLRTRADQALYQAKRSGRDQIVDADDLGGR